MAPLFSIIIPVYNTVRELERCVNSITAQKFENFEVILVDDGSTDGSGKLCDRLSEQDARIRTIHKENGGCSEARNTGIRAAVGEYLMFVDSDDMWDDENALDEIAGIIAERKQIDVICFGVSIYDEDGRLVKVRKPTIPEHGGQSKTELLRHLVYTNQYFSASYVKVLSRKLVFDEDLLFVGGLLSGEDIEWSARVMVLCNALAIYPSAFYKRIRRFSGSITSNIQEKNVTDVIDAIDRGIQFAREHAETPALLDLYFEYWSYQYAMLFGLAGKLSENEQYSDIIRAMSEKRWLLSYHHVPKVLAVNLLVCVFGIQQTCRIMDMVYRRKR